MNSGWRILDLTSGRASLDVDRGTLVVRTPDRDEDRVPAADVAMVLLGPGASFTGGVLHGLAAHDAVLMVCDWRGIPQAISSPWSETSRIGSRQLAQSRASTELRAEAWAQIIRAKLSGQANTLAAFKPRFAPRLQELANRVAPGDADNHEASGARYYWEHLYGKGFTRDHEGNDRVNALLNYGYGILRGHGMRAVLAAGLVPSLGIWHSHRSNPFNLVADLMEPFRPAIDSAVLHLPPYSSLRKTETKKLLAAACELPFASTGQTVSSEIKSLAGRYGRLLEGHRTSLDVHTWSGWNGWEK